MTPLALSPDTENAAVIAAFSSFSVIFFFCQYVLPMSLVYLEMTFSYLWVQEESYKLY